MSQEENKPHTHRGEINNQSTTLKKNDLTPDKPFESMINTQLSSLNTSHQINSIFFTHSCHFTCNKLRRWSTVRFSLGALSKKATL